MKKLFIIIFLTGLQISGLSAQSSLVKQADRYYQQMAYVKAAETYEKALNKGETDLHIYKNLADTYYKIFDPQKAEKYYAILVTKTKDPENYYRYAQMLQANGKYKQSIPWMQRFAKLKPNDPRAQDFNKHPDFLTEILVRGKDKYTVTELANINTEYSDFGAKPLGQKLYFVSARDTKNKKYGWNQQPFLDIYQADYVNDNISNIEKLPGNVNTRYHEGSFCFSPDGKTLYFTRNNYTGKEYKTDSTGINRLKLFAAHLINDEWTNVQELPINNDNYSVGHPAVSPDGKKLYFSSDMPGGYGQSDLYVVDIKENNQFGKPVNLGANINTAGRESFPFISQNGDLYFSSDGHLGLGGLDVFLSKYLNNNFAQPRNLGTPLNSSKDDFAIYFNDQNKNGFISSNRQATRLGDDNIYIIKNIKPACDVLISTLVTDAKTGKALAQASVTLTDDEGHPVKTKLTDDQGKVDFLIACGQNVTIEARAEDFENTKKNIPATADENISLNLSLNPIEKIISLRELDINPIYFDYNKWHIRRDAAFELDKVVAAMKKYPDLKIHIVAHTDTYGSAKYNQALSEKRANATMQYIISKGIDASRLTAEGKGESEPVIKCKPCTKKQDQLNRRSEFQIQTND